MRKLSLFSGIGGIDLAAHWAGMETVAFCEREPFPQRVLRKHWPNVPIYDDVCTLTAEKLKEDGIIGDGRAIDIISAGFPCQPFSHAGQREGVDDERYLWPEVVRVVGDVRPTWFIGENVTGLLSMAEPAGRIEVESRVSTRSSEEDFYEAVLSQQEIMLIGRICKDLEDINYQVQVYVLPAAAVGASHKRDRVFIVANTERTACIERSESNLLGRRQGETKQAGMGSVSRVLGRTEQVVTDGHIQRTAWPVAHSASIRRQGQRKSFEPSHTEAAREWEAGQSVDVCIHAERAAQPRMGRVPDELPAGMDGGRIASLDDLINLIQSYPQPALMGMQQYEWEPPRVASGIKDRTGRLKALGNAVDPLQVYPILAAIKHINDQIQGIEGI